MSESAVVSACIQWLYINKVFAWRNNSGAYKPEGSKAFIRFGFKGSPDIIGMTNDGRFLGIECKSGKNKLTPEQEQFKERCEASGGLYLVIRSVDGLAAYKHLIAPAITQCPPRYADGARPDSLTVKSTGKRKSEVAP